LPKDRENGGVRVEAREMDTMEVWREKMQQDITDLKNSNTHLKSDNEKMKADIQELKMSDKLQDNEINSLKATLNEIKEDTNWIRRKITGALISAIITALVGGVIGIAVAKLF